MICDIQFGPSLFSGLDCGTGLTESCAHHLGDQNDTGKIQLSFTEYSSFCCNTAIILVWSC